MIPAYGTAPDMAARRIALMVFLLVCLDFGDPFVGGAFTFESSADGIQHRRESTVSHAPSGQTRELALPQQEPAPTVSTTAREARTRLEPASRVVVPVAHGHARSDLTPPASDEH